MVSQEQSAHSSIPLRKVRKLPPSSDKDKDRLVPLIAETLLEGGSVLVFCGSRIQTQSGTGMVVEGLSTYTELKTALDLRMRREALVEGLRSTLGPSASPFLENSILNGTNLIFDY